MTLITGLCQLIVLTCPVLTYQAASGGCFTHTCAFESMFESIPKTDQGKLEVSL